MELASEDRVTSLDPIFGSMGIEAGRAIWAMPELTMREKAILFVAADICVPQLELPFELHIGMGLKRAGMSVEDFRELLRHIAPDAGYGITAIAFKRLVEIAKTLGRQAESEGSRPAPSATNVYPRSTMDALRQIDSDFANYVEGQAKQLWLRPGLTPRERSFATLAVDVVGGTLGAPFQAHVALARNAGVSEKELQTAINVLAEFSIPKAWEALIALRRIFADPT
jgi:4-carboxymuconolactone decarboxylase